MQTLNFLKAGNKTDDKLIGTREEKEPINMDPGQPLTEDDNKSETEKYRKIYKYAYQKLVKALKIISFVIS